MVDPNTISKFDQAVRAHRQGRLDEAENYYRQVLLADPRHASALANLAALAEQLGHLDVAERLLRAALESRPQGAIEHSNLGNVLRKLGRPQEAAAACRAALELAPNLHEAHGNLASALQDLGSFAESHDAFRKAIVLRPDLALNYNGDANTLDYLGVLDEAIRMSRRAVQLAPENATVHFSLAGALLGAGQFEEGWKEYEWRLRLPAAAARQFPQPRWHGEPAVGKTLLVHAEQGLGDTIQFSRYLPLIVDRGIRVLFEVQAPLYRLMRSLDPRIGVFSRGSLLPQFDLQCPSMSLPQALCGTIDTIPDRVPYLHPAEPDIARWRARLRPGGRPRVGLCWAGGTDLPLDRWRSISSAALAPLAACGNVDFYSLQKNHPGQLPLPATDLMDEATDLAETAALITQLDLVISVDTAVAHLAGALGRPVWLLNRHAAEWRWQRDCEDSRWYPTLRQFRQARHGDWEEVVARVARRLTRIGGSEASWPS